MCKLFDPSIEGFIVLPTRFITTQSIDFVLESVSVRALIDEFGSVLLRLDCCGFRI